MPPPQGGMGWRGQPYAVNGPQPTMQFQTEIMLLQGDERIRNHREALKSRLHVSGLNLEELEYAVRMMVMRGQFANSAGIPETMLMPALPERFLSPGSPFRTIAELASSIPWLLRVHQSMQWVQQMPNGLMTVQRLICPAASEMGGLAAPDGVLAVDWAKVDEVMARSAEAPPQGEVYRPSMAGDPRFPNAARSFQPGTGGPPGMITGPDGVPISNEDGQMQPTDATVPSPQPEKGGGGGQRQNHTSGRGGGGDQQQGGGKRGGRGGGGGGNANSKAGGHAAAVTSSETAKPETSKSEAAAAGGEAAKASAPPAAPTTTESKPAAGAATESA